MNNTQLVDFLLYRFTESEKVHVIYLMDELKLHYNAINIGNAGKFIRGIKTMDEFINGIDCLE